MEIIVISETTCGCVFMSVCVTYLRSICLSPTPLYVRSSMPTVRIVLFSPDDPFVEQMKFVQYTCIHTCVQALRAQHVRNVLLYVCIVFILISIVSSSAAAVPTVPPRRRSALILPIKYRINSRTVKKIYVLRPKPRHYIISCVYVLHV